MAPKLAIYTTGVKQCMCFDVPFIKRKSYKILIFDKFDQRSPFRLTRHIYKLTK